ncbi:MAG: hypothetical protein R3F45_07340 [Gammaproteobacteria bacterium]
MNRQRCVTPRGLLIVAALIFWCATAGAAQVEVRATVVATDPPGSEITLGRDEPLFVRIEYSTDEPVSIWARPYFEGKQLTRYKSNASFRYSGSGLALGWFSLDEAARVDEIRIRVGGGTPYREREVAAYPVTVTGTGLPAAARAQAAWTGELLREEAARQRQDYERRMNEPVSAGDQLFMSGFMLVVLGLLLGGMALPAWAVWRWRGRWRALAALPALLMAFVALRIVLDTARDPTSHNLWPFEILMFGAGSVAFMGVLFIARRVVRAGD